MTLPNFLIIGAMKSGTTSLHRHLNTHPQIFLPKKKEPHFFSFEGREHRIRQRSKKVRNAITTLPEYEALFDPAGGAKAIGEASTTYLHEEQTPERIRHHIPDARLIAILRDPVERAWSHYHHSVRSGREPWDGFETAVSQEEERLADGWGDSYAYKKKGFYGAQLRRYLEYFPREQMLILLFDDLKDKPGQVFADIVRFLEVDENWQPDFSKKFNVGADPEDRIFRHEEPVGTKLGRLLRGGPWNLPSADPRTRPPFPDSLRRELCALYRQDVRDLEQIVQRDLSHWLKEP